MTDLVSNAGLFRWEQDAKGVEWTLTRGPGTRLGRVWMVLSKRGVITWIGQAASGWVVGEHTDRVIAMALVEAWEHTGPRPLVFRVHQRSDSDDRVELEIEGLMRLTTDAAPPQQLVAVAWEGIATFLGLAPERVVVELQGVVEEEDPECE